VNQAGTITLVNAAVEALFGYTRDELIGRPVELLVPERFHGHHPSDRQRYCGDPRARAMGAGREVFGRCKDGREVAVEIGLTPIQTAQGPFVLASVTDITARKQAELDVRRHRAELAHVTRIATMGELAASLAHELNQPLTAILSNAQAAQRFLAAKPAELEEVREILRDIVQDDRRAGEVIRRLRALVRKEQPTFTSLDLSSVLRDVVLLLHSDAMLRSSRVTVDVSPELPPVRGDRIQLQQVALNLVLNAFDAMKECPVEAREVLVLAARESPHLIRVAVRDGGTGVRTGALDEIFQPFYTTKRDGLGMGLSISRSIIEAHGGRLWAENNPDRGATFYFTVPLGRLERRTRPRDAADPRQC
jgi:two-component system sensor kinase FixL